MNYLLKPLNLLLLFIMSSSLAISSNKNSMYFQTVRGIVIDQDAQFPIIGANVVIVNSSPIIGTSTNVNGNFRIEDVPVGRITIQVSYLGYETATIPNIVVGSGKEVVLKIKLQESVIKMEDITVKAKKQKSETLNEMATVSAKVFTVEETKRYAGTFNDPARMVSSFAGVTSNPSGNNDIIVRGNSPKGILWRLEGVEIPNPNHFANEGASGGPINALNSAMLSNSDFFSGAFAPEYGNALSGVFDMKLRTGNNEKREYTFSGGALGFDGTLEGPFNAGYGGSYLINYRYSSLGLLDDLGLVDFDGVPKYQDLSFKFLLPAGKAGAFSIFGLAGLSNIEPKEYSIEDEDYVLYEGEQANNMANIGLTHSYQFSNKTYVKSSITYSETNADMEFRTRNSNNELYRALTQKSGYDYLKISTTLNHKFSAKDRIKSGVTLTQLGYDNFAENDFQGDGDYIIDFDAKGQTYQLQAYMNWKHRFANQLTMVSGVHYLQLILNGSQAIEPRFGLEYDLMPGRKISAGIGLHSKTEAISTYYTQVEQDKGGFETPNKNLGLQKSLHFVLGYKQQFNQNLHAKMEAYYQHLYDVPVENDPTSPLVLSNMESGYYPADFVNEGSGRNYGLEFTLERFYNNQFYYLLTGSLYQSEFTALDGITRTSAFNGNFASNFLIGKEFPIGKAHKNRSFALNGKLTYMGATPYTPVDLEKSIAYGNTIYDMDQYLGSKFGNVFKADFAVSFRQDRKRTTHEFKIDIQNITNNQAVIGEYYDFTTQTVEQYMQWTIFPNVIYTIDF